MTLSVQHQVMRDKTGRIRFIGSTEAGNLDQYRLGIWLDGSPEELDHVSHVDYLLHPTFMNPLRTSANRGNKFSITFWTWGMFMIHVTAYLKDGKTWQTDYYLSYDLPPDDGTNYVEASFKE